MYPTWMMVKTQMSNIMVSQVGRKDSLVPSDGVVSGWPADSLREE